MTSESVSLVIPGRNSAGTIRQCLAAVVPLLRQADTRLEEIIFVDDGSTDETAKIAATFPVTYLTSNGNGPGAARNTGWRAARRPLVWFIDADCVVDPDALASLLPDFDDPHVGGVGGSYGIMNPGSLLACLIHEEIIERHIAMPRCVDFLATFNVVYRRSVLEQIDGFDERYLKAQDAELSFRVMEAGYELRFRLYSRVKHFHETRWWNYFQTQRRQGYWRLWLHIAHSGHSSGDSYSSLIDHVQPPLAILVLASVPLLFAPYARWVPGLLALLLLIAQAPMTFRLSRRLREPRYLWFVAMSFIRAYWRGIGMTQAILKYLLVPSCRLRKARGKSEATR